MTSEIGWRPAASREMLELRANLLAKLRSFFQRREVLEVETPLLAPRTVTDRHLHSMSCKVSAGSETQELFLQTSPELAMKRLLAAGSGSIFQLCKAFRDQELGRRHNPEFTLLEWYRVGFDHARLMAEVDELLAELLGTPPAECLTYREAVFGHTGVDPFTASLKDLAEAAGPVPNSLVERDGLLQLLFSQKVEPELGAGRPCFVHEYPGSQAALAQTQETDGFEVAERFEVYYRGVELANGFHELSDPVEQRRRFLADLAERETAGLDRPRLDEKFLAALDSGLPDCAGVALGFDRLVMLAAGVDSIEDVLAFPAHRFGSG